MGAVALVFLAHLAVGDEVVVSADCSCDTATLLREELVRFGVIAAFVDTCDLETFRTSLTAHPPRLRRDGLQPRDEAL